MIPHSHCIRLFLLLLFSVKVLSASLNDHCPESQCGGTMIKYPFYLTNPSPPSQQPASSAFCGYRGFGVECDRTTNTPIFKLSGDSYVVKEIDSGSSRLRLTDVEISTIDCPKPGHNLTLGAMTPVLKLDPGTTNFTFLIDCSYYPFLVPAPSSPGYPKQPPSSMETIVTSIKCLDSPVANSSRLNYSYALRPFSATIRTNWASICSRYVIVPYSGNQTEVVQPIGRFPSVVKGGFVLEWGTKDAVCVECEDSGGRCGYREVNSSQYPVPACFCGDGTLGDPVCRGGTAMKVVNLEYSNCAPQTCNGITIKYPFFLPSQYVNGCGYPGFNLSCTNRNTTLLLQAPTFNLVVLSIDYEGQTFNAKIAADSITGINPCSYPNQTINPPSPLNITALDKIQTLYYNCTTTPTGDGGGYVGGSTYDITAQLVPSCSITTSGMYSYAFFDQDSPDSRGVQGMGCQTTVSFPVLTKFEAGDLTASLSSGFILGWSKLDSMPKCVDCSVSRGRCGMNTTTGSFLCFCPDYTYPDTCNGGAPDQVTRKIEITKNNRKGESRRFKTGGGKKVKVIVGLSAGSSALILGMLLTVCYFLYYRKRKRPSPSTVYFTRSLSSSKTSSSLTDMESRSFHQRCGDRVTVFTYRELQEATDDFNSSNEIGDGGFGAVYLGKLHDGRKVAVKKLYENNFRRVEQFMNEIGILSYIEHPNLVQLYGCTSRHSRELLLVYEYIDNGTVSDHIHGSRSAKGHLTWKVRLTIAIETAEALAYLHRLDPPIIHRDVKTSNILLDKGYHVKVADFGLSRLFPVDVTHVSTAPQGTPGYVDPEYHKCYQLTDKSDVYSFGVVLAELISSLPAVDIRRHRHEINLANFAVNKIQNHELHAFVDSSIGFETDQWVKKTVTAVAEMAFRCLSTERDVRPTMDEVAESLRKIELEGLKQGKTTVANSLRKIESEGPKQGKTTVANSLRKIESQGPKQGKTTVANSLRKIESEGPKQGKAAVANSLRKMEPRRSEPEEAAAGPESQKEAGAVPKAAGPLSPNSVTDKWPSHYSTPNNSG